MNDAALDTALRRFPRVLAECAKFQHDATRFQWLLNDGCVEAIRAEYRHVRDKENADV